MSKASVTRWEACAMTNVERPIKPTAGLFMTLLAKAMELPAAAPFGEAFEAAWRTSASIVIKPVRAKASTITNGPATSRMTDQDTFLIAGTGDQRGRIAACAIAALAAWISYWWLWDAAMTKSSGDGGFPMNATCLVRLASRPGFQ
jgi:hypothetical protein